MAHLEADQMCMGYPGPSAAHGKKGHVCQRLPGLGSVGSELDFERKDVLSRVSLTARLFFFRFRHYAAVQELPVSPSLGTSSLAAAATKGKDAGRGPWLGQELEVERGRRGDCE